MATRTMPKKLPQTRMAIVKRRKSLKMTMTKKKTSQGTLAVCGGYM